MKRHANNPLITADDVTPSRDELKVVATFNARREPGKRGLVMIRPAGAARSR